MDDIDYGVAFHGEGQADATLHARWRNEAPTVGDVLRCLGKPALYRAYLGRHPAVIWTQLELWYPDRGLVIRFEVKRTTSTFELAMELSAVSYVKPGLQKELIPRVWAIQPATETYNRILNSLRPWPGEIKDVTIDVDE